MRTQQMCRLSAHLSVLREGVHVCVCERDSLRRGSSHVPVWAPLTMITCTRVRDGYRHQLCTRLCPSWTLTHIRSAHLHFDRDEKYIVSICTSASRCVLVYFVPSASSALIAPAAHSTTHSLASLALISQLMLIQISTVVTEVFFGRQIFCLRSNWRWVWGQLTITGRIIKVLCISMWQQNRNNSCWKPTEANYAQHAKHVCAVKCCVLERATGKWKGTVHH